MIYDNVKKPMYCLSNKEVIEDFEKRIEALEAGGTGGDYVAGDGIDITDKVISNTAPNVQADYNVTDANNPAFIKNKPIPEIGQNRNMVLKSDVLGHAIEWAYYGPQFRRRVFDSAIPVDKAGLIDVLTNLSIGGEIIFSHTETMINVSGAIDQYAIFGKFTKVDNDIAVGSAYTRKSGDFSNRKMLSQIRFVGSTNMLDIYEMDGITGHSIDSFVFSGNSGRILITYFE